MKESLNNVCLEGTATQTRKAIQAISKGYAQKVARVTLGKLAQSLFDQGKEKKSRPAAFDGKSYFPLLFILSTLIFLEL